MIPITQQEQKTIMLNILGHIDRICRDNSIKYSLIGGSLIGVVRHKGYIPWDDDIDIVLTKENYGKLKKILDQETGRYQTLKYGHGGERYIFTKFVDTYTCLIENRQKKYDPNYGIYIDIFCYYPTSDNVKKRKSQYRKIALLESLIARRKLDFKNESIKQNILCAGKNIVSRIIGYKRIRKCFMKVLNRYNDRKYLVSNWPAYGFEKEIQLTKNTEEYIDAEFEGLKVMIFKNYDDILRTTFGDYMKLPPESERTPKHNMKAWWREGREDTVNRNEA